MESNENKQEIIELDEIVEKKKEIPIFRNVIKIPTLLKRNLSKRDLFILFWIIIISILSCLLGLALLYLINFLINLCFYGHASFQRATAAHNKLGIWVIPIPVIGGIIVGLMAHYGSSEIRGHGIPEAMASILHNSAKIPPKMVFLKPISAAICVGTGGPFGAEGPIIATGAAFGSLFGQIIETTKRERVTFVAVGASSGMTAIFNAPLSSVFISLELLLNEYNPFSLICVSLGASISFIIRAAIIPEPIFFQITDAEFPSLSGMFVYLLVGVVSGLISVFISKLLYFLETIWEKSPIPNIAQPAIGSVFIGVIGYFFPRTLSVGYENITDICSNKLTSIEVLIIFLTKGSSWVLSLSSGTSGGTLAPLFTLGSAVGALVSLILKPIIPGVDVTTASITGMSATFGGCSRAFLMSIAFSIETTQQIRALPAVVLGTSVSYLISISLMKYSIMTEKLNRKGQPIVQEIAVDFLQITFVKELMKPLSKLVAIHSQERVELKELISKAPDSQSIFPILGPNGGLVGILSKDEIVSCSNSKVYLDDIIKEDEEKIVPALYLKNTLRQALDYMVQTNTKSLPVVFQREPHIVVGILSKQDIKLHHKKIISEQILSDSTPKIKKSALIQLFSSK